MEITLINLYTSTGPANYYAFNHGLGYLSSVLKGAGHRTRLVSISRADALTDRKIEKIQDNIVFVYLTTNQYPLFSRIMPILKEGRNRTFLGGPHAIVSPEELLNIPGVEGVCTGEGEKAAYEIAEREQKDLSGIPNLLHGPVKKGRDRGPLHWEKALDRLPFPDREIFPYAEMMKGSDFGIMGFEFMAGRGCSYSCRYCINPFLNRSGCPARKRSVGNLLSEIEAVISRYGYSGTIGFHDDIFPLDKRWLSEFCSEYPDRIGLPFWCNSRIDLLDPSNLKMLKKAGCGRIHVGIECGNEKIRRQVLYKDITDSEILEKTGMLKNFGIKVVATFMIGIPSETEEDLKKTLRLCGKIRPSWILYSVFCPYPGTELYEELVKGGFIKPDFYKTMPSDSFYSPVPSFKHPSLSREKIQYYYENFVDLSLG